MLLIHNPRNSIVKYVDSLVRAAFFTPRQKWRFSKLNSIGATTLQNTRSKVINWFDVFE